MMHIKEPFLLIRKSSLCEAAGLLSCYWSGPVPYVCLHIIKNKTVPSFLPPNNGTHCNAKYKGEEMFVFNDVLNIFYLQLRTTDVKVETC